MRSSCFNKLVVGSLFVVPLGLLGGCGDTLETGYQYHKLDSTDADRRSYYAPAFTPESHVTKHETDGFSTGE